MSRTLRRCSQVAGLTSEKEKGKWKLVTLEPPFRESDFQLFDIEADLGEVQDLSDLEPERYQAMLRLWRQERERLGILWPNGGLPKWGV